MVAMLMLSLRVQKIAVLAKVLLLLLQIPAKLSLQVTLILLSQADILNFRGLRLNTARRTNTKGDLITVAGKRNRITNNKFDDFDNQDGAWIKLKGQYNRIDHNEFSGKRSVGSLYQYRYS